MNYWATYKVVFEFHKKYAEVSTNDEYWNDMAREIDAIMEKDPSNLFLRSLLFTVVEELERQGKNC